MVLKALKLVAVAAMLFACSNASAIQDCGGCDTQTQLDPMRNCGRGITQYQAAAMWAGYCQEDCSYNEKSTGCGDAIGNCGSRLHGFFHRSGCDSCGLRGGRHRAGCGLLGGGGGGCETADAGCGAATSGCSLSCGGLMRGMGDRLRNSGIFGSSCGVADNGCGLLAGRSGCGLFGGNSGCGGCEAAPAPAPAPAPACDTGCGAMLGKCGCKLGFFRGRSNCGRTCKLRSHGLLAGCNNGCVAANDCDNTCDNGCGGGLMSKVRGLFGSLKRDRCKCNNRCGFLSRLRGSMSRLRGCGNSCGFFKRVVGKLRGGCMKSCVSGQLTGACGCASPCGTGAEPSAAPAADDGNSIMNAVDESEAVEPVADDKN